MSRALWVTGAGGFAGRAVLELAARRGLAAAALVPEAERAALAVPSLTLDLEQAARADPGAAVIDLEALPEPSGLLHLAAIAFPPACEADPPRARAVNVVGPARLYEQVLGRWPELPILHVSSAQVYRSQAEPLREEQAAEPVNVYGATKLHGEALALGLRDRGHRLTVARPFNHAGPGQSADFALPSFALRLAALERGGGGVLEVGRLDAVRDFLHVREVAACYLDLLPQAGMVEVVNVGSGVGRRMDALLEGLLRRISAAVELRVAVARLRGERDPGVLVADVTRLRSVLGYVPLLDVEALLDELMDDARRRVAADAAC